MSWRSWERRQSPPPNGRTRAVPPATAPPAHRWQSLPHASPEALALYSRTSSHLHFLLEHGTRAPRLKDLQVTFLVKLRDVVRHAIGQELASHVHEQAVVARAVIDQRLHEFRRHERRIAG